LQAIQTEVIRDAKYPDITDVLIRIYSGDYNDTLGVCRIKIDKNGIAEIYSIQILNESNRRKHYGSTLWKFAENYVIKKYRPNRFVGELHLENIPAIEFWKSHDFQILPKKVNCGMIVKSVEY